MVVEIEAPIHSTRVETPLAAGYGIGLQIPSESSSIGTSFPPNLKYYLAPIKYSKNGHIFNEDEDFQETECWNSDDSTKVELLGAFWTNYMYIYIYICVKHCQAML